MLVEVVVDFFAGIQFVRWRYRWGRVFLFLDLINSLIIPQGYFALRYTILGEDSTIECLAVPKEKGYLFVCYFLTKVDKLEYYRNKEQWITALYDATYQELNFCKNKWYVRWSGVYKISQLIEFYEAADKVTQSFSLIRKGITNCYPFILFLLRIYFTAYASNPKHLFMKHLILMVW